MAPVFYVFAQHETGDKRKVEVTLSNRQMPVKDLLAKVQEVYGIEPDDQRLVFRGKVIQAEDANGRSTTLFDYGISRNDTVSMLIPKSQSMKIAAEAAQRAAAAAAEQASKAEVVRAAGGAVEPEAPTGGTARGGAAAQDAPEQDPVGACILDEAGHVVFLGHNREDPSNNTKGVPTSDGVKCRWSRYWTVTEELQKQQQARLDAEPPVAQEPVKEEKEVQAEDGWKGKQVFTKRGKDDVLMMGEVVEIKGTGPKQTFSVYWGEDDETQEGLTLEQVTAWLPAQGSKRNRAKPKPKASAAQVAGTRHTIIVEQEIVGTAASLPPASCYKILHRAPGQKGFKLAPGQTAPKVTAAKLRFELRKDEGQALLPLGDYTVGLTLMLSENDCAECRGNEDVLECLGCGCQVCKKKTDTDHMLMCDDCNLGFHTTCLEGLRHSAKEGVMEEEEIPEGDWYCHKCYNDPDKVVQAKLQGGKGSKKKKLPASATCTKNWGGGMACMGRTKVCSAVDAHHFGALPGIKVGSLWQYRLEVSEDGVHRPHVSGMAGTAEKGCQSIVLSGGYSDDEDEGEVFLYTGSGGRDLSGNKRTAKQSMDQDLSRFNAALARNCNAKDWKKGKPVRVIRASKLDKTSHGAYAPHVPEGWAQSFRYDGLYKVAKFGACIGGSGHRIYRYLLARDDPEPAPWSQKGRQSVPDLRSDASKNEKENNKRKREAAEADGTADKDGKKACVSKDGSGSASKEDWAKDKELRQALAQDKTNDSKWAEVLKAASASIPLQSQSDALKAAESEFACTVCIDLVQKPVTTPCAHNFCYQCFQHSIKHQAKNSAQMQCPSCRAAVPEAFANKPVVNDKLQLALKLMYPGARS